MSLLAAVSCGCGGSSTLVGSWSLAAWPDPDHLQAVVIRESRDRNETLCATLYFPDLKSLEFEFPRDAPVRPEGQPGSDGFAAVLQRVHGEDRLEVRWRTEAGVRSAWLRRTETTPVPPASESPESGALRNQIVLGLFVAYIIVITPPCLIFQAVTGAQRCPCAPRVRLLG